MAAGFVALMVAYVPVTYPGTPAAGLPVGMMLIGSLPVPSVATNLLGPPTVAVTARIPWTVSLSRPDPVAWLKASIFVFGGGVLSSVYKGLSPSATRVDPILGLMAIIVY